MRPPRATPRGAIAACAIVLLSFAPPSRLHGSGDPWEITAIGHEKRVDIVWSPPAGLAPALYRVERSPAPDGPFATLSANPHESPVFSNFLGTNEQRYFYRVIALDDAKTPIGRSPVVHATSRAMNDSELLTSIQEATFRYFWHGAHPVSGLARERKGSRDTVTSGGSGFGLMAILVGVERGFITRSQAAERLRIVTRFLEEKADRFHGAWPHWLDGATGRTIPFSRYDDGADLVETAFLIQGLLTVRRYFDRDDERDIRERCARLWEDVEWDWFLKEPQGRRLYWHWSPNHGWKMNHPIGGHFNEAMIVYLLAIASPTHPVPASCYHEGWVGQPPTGYLNGTNYFGHTLAVGLPFGGPLFFTHYSFLGFDPRGKRDDYCDYFENNRQIALIHHAYATANPAGHKGYSALVWGLTASDTPGGYHAHDPAHDNGTITPSAALASMPYLPEASLATLRHLYDQYGSRLWGEFGFKDAFNLDHDWFADSYLAIDQGPIVIMIENYRSGLCWRLFMSNSEIPPMLDKIGFRTALDPTDPGR